MKLYDQETILGETEKQKQKFEIEAKKKEERLMETEQLPWFNKR
jgi:hypothetical protein